VDRRDELAGDDSQKDAWREVVFAEPVAKLGVLGECLREWKRNRLG